ncbi:hypothetical protein PTTW11_02926 [Pyrenophora teres f. teres]|uniref:Uncharacterized protein n=1 Tax=Pyrenophora teres f. teres TaxID=97479 RepID=A0A6S6VWH6_9PLEO|nr:hypothetical protein PTTW11_02926 [Pyrenophora teres f. teres]
MPTSITTRQWYLKVYEDEHANTQLDPATDAIIPGQINTIAIDWVKDNVACGPNYVPTIGTIDNTTVDQPSLPKVSIAAHTDLRSLYNFLVKLGTTKEKHRMIDIMTLREAYGHNDLMDIRWIDSRDNLVDAITKARWVDRDKTGIGTINNQLQYKQDRHQAYKQDRHQAYEQDRHRAYRQDRHQAYKQDRHRAYERWHRTHE